MTGVTPTHSSFRRVPPLYWRRCQPGRHRVILSPWYADGVPSPSASFEDDPDLVERYLGCIRTGDLRYEAARSVGVTPRHVQLFAANHPEFADALADAEAEAAEPIERAVYEAAVAGEEWAVKLWLGRRQKDRWGETKAAGTTNNIVIVTADELADLEARLASRQRELSSGGALIVDAESEEA